MFKLIETLKYGKVVEIPFTFWESFALYPFIFVRKGSKIVDRYIINHERIHIMQQKEIYKYISLPLGIISYAIFGICEFQLCLLFLPTLLYYLFWLLTYPMYGFTKSNRYMINFEMEAALNQYNLEYCKSRTIFANLLYVYDYFDRTFNK